MAVHDTVVSTAVCYHDVSCGADVAWGQVQGFPLYYPVSEDLLTLFRSLPATQSPCCRRYFQSPYSLKDL